MSMPGAVIGVVGAGIGGLAVAAGLRARGMQAIVWESADALRADGSALTLWSNGMGALHRLLPADAVEGLGQASSRAVSLDGSGRLVADWRLSAVPPSRTVRRGELLTMLYERAGADDVVEFGRPVVGYLQEPDGVTVKLADGVEHRVSLLLGADGAGSTLRAQVSEVQRTGGMVWHGCQGIASGVDVVPSDAIAAVYGAAAGGLAPLGGGRTHWFVDVPTELCDSVDSAGLHDRLRQWVAPRSRVLHEAILATRPGDTRHDRIRELRQRIRWVDGRVALLGDAAHAMLPALGQGACQTLEDAAALVHLIARDPGPAALSAYAAARTPRARGFIRGARQTYRLRQQRFTPRLLALLPDGVAGRRLSATIAPI